MEWPNELSAGAILRISANIVNNISSGFEDVTGPVTMTIMSQTLGQMETPEQTGSSNRLKHERVVEPARYDGPDTLG